MPTAKVVLPGDQNTTFEEGDTCKKEKKCMDNKKLKNKNSIVCLFLLDIKQFIRVNKLQVFKYLCNLLFFIMYFSFIIF